MLDAACTPIQTHGGAALGHASRQAIVAPSEGEPFGDEPAWWAEFEAQYQEWQARKAAEAEQAPDVDRSVSQ
jgi:hypothetical protein